MNRRDLLKLAAASLTFGRVSPVAAAISCRVSPLAEPDDLASIIARRRAQVMQELAEAYERNLWSPIPKPYGIPYWLVDGERVYLPAQQREP